MKPVFLNCQQIGTADCRRDVLRLLVEHCKANYSRPLDVWQCRSASDEHGVPVAAPVAQAVTAFDLFRVEHGIVDWPEWSATWRETDSAYQLTTPDHAGTQP